jgi:hypothetical protein
MRRRRRQPRWRAASRTIRRRLKSRFAAFVTTTGDVVRLFGWLYVVVLVPALLSATYLVIREATAGGDVLGSLHMLPLAMIWPLAAVALRREGTLALTFPLNVVVLIASVAFVIIGWTVLIRVVRDFIRWRAAR